ncbi:hypothetical protein FPV67DRAFT_889892 [Lyophyllum atratum]|nr:hypothetical protein FPV67DRAFT_889892 [Lyophyllum atratum]
MSSGPQGPNLHFPAHLFSPGPICCGRRAVLTLILPLLWVALSGSLCVLTKLGGTRWERIKCKSHAWILLSSVLGHSIHAISDFNVQETLSLWTRGSAGIRALRVPGSATRAECNDTPGLSQRAHQSSSRHKILHSAPGVPKIIRGIEERNPKSCVIIIPFIYMTCAYTLTDCPLASWCCGLNFPPLMVPGIDVYNVDAKCKSTYESSTRPTSRFLLRHLSYGARCKVVAILGINICILLAADSEYEQSAMRLTSCIRRVNLTRS